MHEEKRGRITNTAHHEAFSGFFERGDREGFFNTIAHLSIGYGCKNCNDTELTYFESVSFFIKAAAEEGSTVFILGFAPRAIPASWVKAAELIIKGSEVKTVLIPFAELLEKGGDSWHPTCSAGMLYVSAEGVIRAEAFGILTDEEFWRKVVKIAKSVNQPTMSAV